ncbi:ATP synthase subunit O, mitochondrial [Hondaea fermentalgiana]|uniref:ATP synthase subunit O, mitochondrial n=1 Tax=Hondaea fermentalgiana TaxID=2315210 RepID=A0A2R5GHS2_9STRA|nr:ATP synthase subunit O, mitochondrial [Hondaea fermentalgiana]|eukprot:GBG30432.1 ATP synthase subunit O, mitochondrial [Hondaea fermentalgiana]
MLSSAAKIAARGARVNGVAQMRLTGARGFAAAADKKPVELPVQLYGLSARYANALFVACQRAQTLPSVEQDLATLKEWSTSNETFKSYINNPVISRQDKVKDMSKISEGMNDTTRGFLTVLAENGRLNELDKVLDTFQILLNAQRGVVEATVTAAEDLTSKQLKSIEKAITSGYLDKGQSLNLKVKVDEGIVGGLQVQIGDRFLDLSVASQMNGIAKAIA